MLDLSKIAKNKSKKVRELIHDGVKIIDSVQVPIEQLTARRLERMAMCFLALCGITKPNSWNKTKSISSEHILRSRQIIEFVNMNYEESISPGSYDDIRRKDLKMLVMMGLVVKSANNPNADTNDGTRGYALEENFADLVRCYKTRQWSTKLESFEVDTEYLKSFYGKRDREKLSVRLEEDLTISLDTGPHNEIQKAVIEKFLPNFGYESTVLYVGDTSAKQIHKYSERMIALGLNIEDRGMLPDIVAFSEQKQWLYLIEAVHSSNPLNADRCIELKRTVLKDCPYGVVFVTAFLNRSEFRKWLPEIAWETEVWLVDNPEHLIHFNGDRFLGPHEKEPEL